MTTPATLVIVGLQWGDEGKGKLVDAFAANADCVSRFQGGNNAGHTLVVNGVKTRLSLVPSGILHETVHCLLGAGVVIDPEVLFQELTALDQSGVPVSPERFTIDFSATLILPFHRLLDAARETARADEKIGTTGRGIGPAYEDRSARVAVCVAELSDLESLRTKAELLVREKNEILAKVFLSAEQVQFDRFWAQLTEWAPRLTPYLGDVGELIADACRRGRRVVFEGAQGTFLDQTHGTVPFVTSSHTVAGAVCTGCGVGPTLVQHVLGVTKAYATRVGEGPFPTELHDGIGAALREKGMEFGTVTGRPRRCGWLDAVLLRRAVRLNGATSLAVTKLDVLSGFDTLKICTAYSEPGGWSWGRGLEQVAPEWLEVPGWTEDLSDVRSWDRLPQRARDYLATIERLVECPISVVSVGPEREQLLVRDGTGEIGGWLTGPER